MKKTEIRGAFEKPIYVKPDLVTLNADETSGPPTNDVEFAGITGPGS